MIFSIGVINEELRNTNLINDKATTGGVLMAISIVAVIACFGAFAFTYEKVNKMSVFQRYVAHFTTGSLMLIIGIAIIFTSILISYLIGSIFIINFILVGLYLSIIGFEVWDLLRN